MAGRGNQRNDGAGVRLQAGGAMTAPSVIARRAAPWQSMSLWGRRWIASFLAMTGQGRNDEAGAQ